MSNARNNNQDSTVDILVALCGGCFQLFSACAAAAEDSRAQNARARGDREAEARSRDRAAGWSHLAGDHNSEQIERLLQHEAESAPRNNGPRS